MRARAILLLFGVLQGCSTLSLGPALKSNAVSYHDTIEGTQNDILVTNILRARDHAPLYFSDLSIVRGSMQEAGSLQAVFPFGAPHGSSARDSLQIGGISLQNSPGFDLGSLNTQDFTKGILSPIDPIYIKNFLEQGMDPRIVLILFFSGIKTADGNMIQNDPDRRAFFDYLGFVNRSYNGLYANAFYELKPIGPTFPIDMAKSFKDVAALDPTKTRLKLEKNGRYQLYRIAANASVAFCRYLGQDTEGRALYALLQVARTSARSIDRACSANQVVVTGTPSKEDTLYVRSPAAIIEFLGALLRLQEREHRSITVDAPPGSQTLFRLHRLPRRARFEVLYRNTRYYVEQETRRDHTLQILAILTQLLDLYKSAKDIPSTRSVTVVP